MRHEIKKPNDKAKIKSKKVLSTRLVLAVLRRREYGLCLSMVAICFPKMTILMLVWCIWLSVCVSGFDLPPFPVGGLDLPVGTGNPSWCIVCAAYSPSSREVLRAVA